MIYINARYADHIEDAAHSPDHANLPAHDQTVLERAMQRLYRNGLEVDPGQISDTVTWQRCEATRIWCDCVQVGTRKIKKKQGKH